MARRRSSSAPPPKQPAYLSPQEIRAAIPKLERRLREVEGVEIDTWDEEVHNSLHTKIDTTLVEVFGADSLDYQQFEVPGFMYSVSMSTRGTPPQEWLRGYQKAVNRARTKLYDNVAVR